MEADRIFTIIDEIKYHIANDESDIEDIDRLNEVKAFIESIGELLAGTPALNESAEAMAPVGGWNIYNSEVTIIISPDSGICSIIQSDSRDESIPPTSEG